VVVSLTSYSVTTFWTNGSVTSTCARVRGGWFRENGKVIWVQSSVQVSTISAADQLLQPAMKRSSVARWTWAGAGIVSLGF
jgi:hypothetical protein